MISRSRANINLPATLLSQDCSDSLNSLVDDILSNNIKRGKDKISASFYRGNQISPLDPKKPIQDVVVALLGIYDNKCAFCESKNFTPDVEHFRPKKRVTGIINHNGYYWLCYEWTNLIPVCTDCNKTKGTNFPIEDESNRQYSPIYSLNGLIDLSANTISSTVLENENSILLHPEIDDVENQFIFNNEGRIIEINSTNIRAIESIKICNLNRKNLLFWRQKVIDDYKEHIELAMLDNNQNTVERIINKLRRRALNKSDEYTLLAKYLYNNFDEVLIPLLPAPIQHVVNLCYQRVFVRIL